MINNFSGQYRFLSNFYPCEIEYGGDIYTTVEHAYQAAKNPDATYRLKIREEPKPGKAKRLGYSVQLGPNWEAMKMFIMDQLLRQKFSNPDLKVRLLRTGTHELVEENTWNDTFWGTCNGVGENKLGKLLMKIREGHANN